MHEHLLTFLLTFLCSHWCAQWTLDSVIRSRASRIVCDSQLNLWVGKKHKFQAKFWVDKEKINNKEFLKYRGKARKKYRC